MFILIEICLSHKFADWAKHWQKHIAFISETFAIEDFPRRIAPDPMKKQEFLLAVLKSYSRLEELAGAVLQIQETGILKFFQNGQQVPLWVNVNPYKWSEYSMRPLVTMLPRVTKLPKVTMLPKVSRFV